MHAAVAGENTRRHQRRAVGIDVLRQPPFVEEIVFEKIAPTATGHQAKRTFESSRAFSGNAESSGNGHFIRVRKNSV